MSDENSQWVPRDPGTRPEAWTDQVQQTPYASGAGQAPAAGAVPQAPSAAPGAAETEQFPRMRGGTWSRGAEETARLPRTDGAAAPLNAQETTRLPRVGETMQLPRVQETAQLPSAAAGQFQSEASPAYGQAGLEAGPAYGQPPAEASPAYGQAAPGGDGSHDFPPPVGQMPLQQGAPELAPVTGKAAAKKGPGWFALVASMLVTALVTAGGLWFVLRPDSTQNTSAPPANGGTVASVASTGSAPDWQAVASAVSPAVVTIQVQSSSSTGMGSGVVYDAKGDIVTNYHVISAAVQSGGKIQVTLADGRIYDAEVVGHDRTTDLAVIRLVNPPSDLTVARFGSSSQLTVGSPVMAIGAPLGLSKTVTTGIVSALNRPVEVAVDDDSSNNNGQGDSSDPFGQQKRNQSSSDTVITNAIQVDASLNPGNSGGPLFDQTGAVVGINSSIKSVTSSDGQAGSIGLGFAIPSDLVTSVADQLIANGTVSHAVLGVNIATATVSVGGDTYAGAEIADVTSGGAADKAGLRKGDVITQVEGQEVSSAKQLTGYIRRYKGGDTVKLTYVRDGASHEVQVVLQAK